MGVIQSSLEMKVQIILCLWLSIAWCVPQSAHVSPLAPHLSAHPNAAHTSPLLPAQSAHPNPAHTAYARPDCARFQGAYPCAPGDVACEAAYKTSGCGRKKRSAQQAFPGNAHPGAAHPGLAHVGFAHVLPLTLAPLTQV